MDGAAVKEIRDIVINSQKIEYEGGVFVPGNYKELEFTKYREDTVNLSTLTSLADFIEVNPNFLDLEGAFVVINKDLSVSLLSSPDDDHRKRTLFAHAQFELEQFSFNRFIEAELFNILLQTLFIYDQPAQNLFTIASKLQIDEGITISDDGLTQNVTVKKGMSAASAVGATVATRVQLKPYRIFPECDQPASQFLTRIKGDKESGAYVGLWETDGGMWRVEAANNIANKLIDLDVKLPIYY